MASPTGNSRTKRGWRHHAIPAAESELHAAVQATAELHAAAHEADSFADLFEHAPVGYLLLDTAGHILRINQTGAAMLGWESAWLLDKPFARWILSGDRKAFHEYRRQLRDSEVAFSQEVRIKSRQGRIVDLRLESTPDRRRTGACRTIMIDISGERLTGRRMRRLQSQLAHITRLHTAGELASSLAHEINQPLGTVVLNCEVAMRLLRADTGEVGECLEAMSQASSAAQYASEVIRHLRGFLRKNGDLYQDCKLRGIICDVITIIETDARDNDVEVQVDIEAGLPSLRADPVQIEQVLINLTHNSVEAMAECADCGSKRVVIRAVSEPPDCILVSVEDTGPGLLNKQAERVFSPFYTTKSNGMGMGLSISRTIIEAHGGQLWLDGDATPGAAFRFSLPVARAKSNGA